VTSAFPLHRYTYQDYVWLEQESTVRHEFLSGEIVAVAGGTPEHAAMAAEVIGQLRERLRGGPCRVFTSDLGVRVLETGLATYPDASVVCGPTVRDPDKEDYDRGEKLAQYQHIPTLEAVVVISHRMPRIEVWSRSPASERWERAEAGAGGAAAVTALGCALDVDAIWHAAAERA